MAPQQSEWSTLKSANLTELEPTNAVHQPRLLKSGPPTEKFAIRYVQAHHMFSYTTRPPVASWGPSLLLRTLFPGRGMFD